MRVKVWLKDPGDNVPLCYCHGVTRSQIKTAWQKGAKTFAELVKVTGVAKGGCRCQYENPAGRCCSEAIKQYLGELAKSIN
ncbi:MAG: (2Fe-2S)-binding protein [Firmicutes bacterium]|nr:(2Fe-2S)-binding protein [Bacillota bacterium]